jgi:putative hydrolase of the HAD superfamily
LKDFFKNVHIVSEKQTATYSTIFGADVQISAMVGNSIKSDIVPVLNAGAAAIYVPARYEWDMGHGKSHRTGIKPTIFQGLRV